MSARWTASPRVYRWAGGMVASKVDAMAQMMDS